MLPYNTYTNIIKTLFYIWTDKMFIVFWTKISEITQPNFKQEVVLINKTDGV